MLNYVFQFEFKLHTVFYGNRCVCIKRDLTMLLLMYYSNSDYNGNTSHHHHHLIVHY